MTDRLSDEQIEARRGYAGPETTTTLIDSHIAANEQIVTQDAMIRRLEERVAELEKWNNAVAVCKDHVEEIVDVDPGVCVICRLNDAERERDEAREERDTEKRRADNNLRGLRELRRERQRDALEGQAALDEANNAVVEAREEVERADKAARLHWETEASLREEVERLKAELKLEQRKDHAYNAWTSGYEKGMKDGDRALRKEVKRLKARLNTPLTPVGEVFAAAQAVDAQWAKGNIVPQCEEGADALGALYDALTGAGEGEPDANV